MDGGGVGVGLEMFSLEGWDRVDGWGWRGYNYMWNTSVCVLCVPGMYLDMYIK